MKKLLFLILLICTNIVSAEKFHLNHENQKVENISEIHYITHDSPTPPALSDKWNKLNYPFFPEDVSKNTRLWLKISLNGHIRENPAVYFKIVSNKLTVFHNGEEVYRNKNIRLSPYRYSVGYSWHFISLEKKVFSDLYIRIDNVRYKRKLFRSFLFGNTTTILTEFFKKDFIYLFAGFFLLFMAIIQFIILSHGSHLVENIYYSLFILTTGFLSFSMADMRLFIISSQAVWDIIQLLSLFIMPAMLLGYFYHVVEKRLLILLLLKSHIILTVIVLIASVSQLFPVIISMFFFRSIFLIEMFFMTYFATKNGFLKKHFESKVFAISLYFLLALGVYQILITFGKAPALYVPATIQIMLILVLALQFLTRTRMKQNINNLKLLNKAYQRFVPHNFLDILQKDNITELNFGDQVEKNMTVMFVDIRNFTTLSEAMSPCENFKFLNSYLSRVAPIIEKHNGFIDKYIGDSIMALFSENSTEAIAAAIEINEYLIIYNKYRHNYNYPPIEIGIGIHTGPLILGTVGFSKRMESTVISDTVNIAARLQQLTRKFKTPTIISSDVLFNTEDPTEYSFRFIGSTPLKGKTEEVPVFEILDGLPPSYVNKLLLGKEDFLEGLIYYLRDHIEPALLKLSEAQSRSPEDYLITYYIEQCNKKLAQRAFNPDLSPKSRINTPDH